MSELDGFRIEDQVKWWGSQGQIIALVDSPSAVVEFGSGNRITISLSMLSHMEIGPIEKCRDCGREEWGHSWLDHAK